MTTRAGVVAGALVALALVVPAGGLQQSGSNGGFSRIDQLSQTGQMSASQSGQSGQNSSGYPSGSTSRGNRPGDIPNTAPKASIDMSLDPDEEVTPFGRNAQQANNAMNIQRHKQLASDTDKLLALATELKAEVDKSTKDTLSISVIRKAEAIEKLAHSVKDKMKN